MKKRIAQNLILALFVCALAIPNSAQTQGLLLALACAKDGYDIDLDAFMALPDAIKNATTSDEEAVFFEKIAADEYAKGNNHNAVKIDDAFVEAEINNENKYYRNDTAVGVFWGCADRKLADWMDELGGEYVAWDPAWDVGNERRYNHYYAFMEPDNEIIEGGQETHFVRSEEAVTAGYTAAFDYGYMCDALLEVTLDESCNNLFANGLSMEACDPYAGDDTGDTGGTDTGSKDTGAEDTGTGGDTGTGYGDTGVTDTGATASKSAAKSPDIDELTPCSGKNTEPVCTVQSKFGSSQVYLR
jgi:hypothetical protein